LDNAYILKWLRDFEQVIDDSTLVQKYQQMRKTKSFKLK